jgi:hypothetical protein
MTTINVVPPRGCCPKKARFARLPHEWRLAALPLLLICGGACTTYTVRKSALAPHIAPPMRSGQDMGGATAEAAVGASALARGKAPVEGEDANAGLYIPRVEVVGALRKRISEDLDLGILYDHGFRRGAYATSEDQPEPRNGSVYGFGVSGFYSVPTGSPGLRVGIGLDLLTYSIPYVEYRTCVDFCGGTPYTRVDHDRDSVGVYSLAVIPSWKSGRFTLFGGGTVRNHPTIEKGSIEGVLDSDDEVDSGPPNFIVHAGLDVELGQGIRAMAMVYQPVDRSPVEYAPTLGVGLTLPLGRYKPPKPAAAPPPAPYYGYPPPQPYPPPPQPYPPPPQPYPPPQPAPPPPAPQPAPPPPPPPQ